MTRPRSPRAAVLTLTTLHLSRLRRPATATVLGMVILSSLDVFKHGWRLDSIIPWFLGGAMILPLAPAFTLVREKADGSLRYLASLPVSGERHALARALVAGAASLPAGVLAVIAMRLMVPGVGAAMPLAAGAGVAVGMTALSLSLLAMQIKVPIGEAATYVVYALVGFLVLTKVVTFASENGWLDGVRNALQSRIGLASASAAFWLVCILAATTAMRSIARTSVRYRGEISRA